MNITEEIKSGNEKAFEEVFHQLYPQLCAHAFTFLKDPDESEETVQNIFVKLWNRRAEFDIKVSLKSYLYQSVRNECLNVLKHQKIVDEHAAHVQKSASISVSDEVIASELQQRINEATSKMPPERKRIFLMNRNDGKKYREIAEELNISVKTVENQMGKALQFLRGELAEYLSLILITMLKWWN